MFEETTTNTMYRAMTRIAVARADAEERRMAAVRTLARIPGDTEAVTAFDVARGQIEAFRIAADIVAAIIDEANGFAPVSR